MFLIAFIVVCRSVEKRIFVFLVLEAFWERFAVSEAEGREAEGRLEAAPVLCTWAGAEREKCLVW